MKFGFDINRYKYPVNIPALLEAGGQFIIGKATDGVYYPQEYINMHLEWKATCRQLNCPYGAYHYYIVSKDGIQQAQYYYDNGLTKAVPMIDLERTNNAGIYSKATFTSRFRDHILAVEDTFQKQPIIYTNWYSVNSMTTEPSWFADYLLWVASYGVDSPTMPVPWISKFWTMWQFSETCYVGGDTFDANYLDDINFNFNKIFGINPEMVINKEYTTKGTGNLEISSDIVPSDQIWDVTFIRAFSNKANSEQRRIEMIADGYIFDITRSASNTSGWIRPSLAMPLRLKPNSKIVFTCPSSPENTTIKLQLQSNIIYI